MRGQNLCTVKTFGSVLKLVDQTGPMLSHNRFHSFLVYSPGQLLRRDSIRTFAGGLMFVSCHTLAADDSKSGAGDDFDEVADGVGGQPSKELVRVEKVLVDADFTGNCIVGLTNGMGPS
jgi:hypothetical protein